MPRPKKQDNEQISDMFAFQAPDELEAALADIPGDNSKITLWRVNPQGRPSFLCSMSPVEFDLEAIKETFGGGQFRYSATSDSAVVKTGRFEIEGVAKGSQQTTTFKKFVPGKGVVYISKAESEELSQTLNENRYTPQPRSEGNDLAIRMLLDEIKSLKEEMRSVPSKDSERDFLEKLQLYKSLFAQPSPTGDFAKQAIDLIKQGMEVANANENGGSPWMMILDKALPTINEAIKAYGVTQARNPAITTPMVQQPAINSQQQPAQALTGFDAISKELIHHVPTFVRSASVGVDPAIFVDMVLPQIPALQIGSVVEWLESPNWFADLSKLHQMIPAQAGWWQGFHDGLLNELKNPEVEIEHEGLE